MSQPQSKEKQNLFIDREESSMDHYPQIENTLNNDLPLVRLDWQDIRRIKWFQQTEAKKPYNDSDQYPVQFAYSEKNVSGIKADKSTIILDSNAKDINIHGMKADTLIIDPSSSPLLSSRSVTISSSEFNHVFIFGMNKVCLMNVEISSQELFTNNMGIKPQIEAHHSPFKATEQQQKAINRTKTEEPSVKYATLEMK